MILLFTGIILLVSAVWGGPYCFHHYATETYQEVSVGLSAILVGAVGLAMIGIGLDEIT